VTVVRLYELKRELAYYLAGRVPTEIDSTQLDRYAAKLTEILDADLENWLKLRAAQSARPVGNPGERS
jgi:hypothetical protein